MRGLTITLLVCLLGQCVTASSITNLETINLISLLEQAGNTLDALQSQGALLNGNLTLTGTFSNTGWTEATTGSTSAGSFSSSYSGTLSGTFGSTLNTTFSGSGSVGSLPFTSSGTMQWVFDSTLNDYTEMTYLETGTDGWGTATAEVLVGGGIGALGFFATPAVGITTSIAGAAAGLAFSNVALGPGPAPPPTPVTPMPPATVPIPPPGQPGKETIIINGANNQVFKNIGNNNGNITINGNVNSNGTATGNVTVSGIPEPASAILTSAGLMALAALSLLRRRRSSSRGNIN
jgi:hypothetical protein